MPSDNAADATNDDAAEPSPPGATPPESGPGTGAAHSPPADSRWWYWVAAVPVYFVVATVVGFAIGIAAFALALTGGASVQHGVWMNMPMRTSAGIGFLFVMLPVMVLVAAGFLLSLLFPLAIYLDAETVAETASDWVPDPMLYGLLGLAGLVAQPLQVPLAVYYLYKRHNAEGTP